MTSVCPQVQGAAEGVSFDVCPAWDLRGVGHLLDLWHACSGRVEALVALVPSASAAIVDAWGVIAAEMDRLDGVIRERARTAGGA